MKFFKIKPNDTTVDHRYQRELDAARAEKMAQDFRPDLVGVPVVSKRADGSYVRIDGQHRLAAAIAAGHGDTPIMMEVVELPSLQGEAEMFLRLNGGRKAVGAIDKYKARVEAKDPIVLEIQGTLKKHGCRIASSPGRGSIMAVTAVEFAYHRGNLDRVIYVLATWLDRETEAFDGAFLRGVSQFLVLYPDADLDLLVKKLCSTSSRSLLAKMRRESRETTPTEGSVFVLANLYNHGTPKNRRLLGMAHQASTQASN